MTDAQWLVNAFFAVSGSLGGFILKATWDALKDLQRDMSALQSSIANTYVRKDDFRDHATRVENALARIEAKFDGKADKHS